MRLVAAAANVVAVMVGAALGVAGAVLLGAVGASLVGVLVVKGATFVKVV